VVLVLATIGDSDDLDSLADGSYPAALHRVALRMGSTVTDRLPATGGATHVRLSRSIVSTSAVCSALPLVIIAALADASQAQRLRIYHIDVNQADATLFVSPSGNTMLVDAGTRHDQDEIKAVMDLAGVTDIDHFVCTHYHSDHMGCISKLVEELGIEVGAAYDRGDTAYVSNDIKETGTYRAYQRVIGSRSRHLMRGESIPLDDAMTVRCLAHGGVVLGEEDTVTTGHDENDMSIALVIKYGDFHYFIAGDIETHTEDKIAAEDLVLDVDVYRSSHHGSDTSSSQVFMEDLSPTLVVISNGNDSGYQHPSQSVLDRYAALDDPPVVLQTNKYTSGGAGGNVADAFIADVEQPGDEGTILLTVHECAGSYEVSYRDTSMTFSVKNRFAPAHDVVIESLLPNPVGGSSVERLQEAITLRNDATADITLTEWTLTDTQGRAWTLSEVTVPAGGSATVERRGMPMNMNNNGDRIYLRDSNDDVIDEFAYDEADEGDVIETGH
jgi:competence protein ComEC